MTYISSILFIFFILLVKWDDLKKYHLDGSLISAEYQLLPCRRTNIYKETHTHIYVYVYFGSISSLIHIWLNIIGIFVYIFFVNPFELLYWSYDIRRELVDKPSIISYFPSTYGPSSGEDVLQKWCNFCMYITTL